MPIRSKIEKAVEVCAAGGIIAYPTEYCFGLGCDPLNETAVRSEEHTSELQSLVNLVCRLLLEKKKNTENETTKQ